MRILTLVLLLLFLGACAPQQAGLSPSVFSSQERPVTLSERLELNAYPGSGILELNDRGRRVTARFTSSVTVFDLITYFELQLTQNRWQRTHYGPPNNTSVDTTFVRDGERIRLRLTHEHPSGMYRLDIR